MIILDVEIKKAILGRGETPLEGIEYCGGWRDFANMGIACVCTYDITSHLTRVFLEEDLAELQDYIRGKPTAGFNTVNFDNQLLAEHGVQIAVDTHYDMLREIWIALGLNPDKFYYKTHGGWSLDATCHATLGIRKTGHGALAPVWWQQGKRGKVIDYCCNDVHMEGSLLLHIIRNAGLVTNGEQQIRVAQPKLQFSDEEAARFAYEGEIIGRQYRKPMDVNNIVGGPNESELAKERAAMREQAEKRAADIFNAPQEAQPVSAVSPGGLGIVR